MSDIPPTGPGPENEPKPTDPAATGATPSGDAAAPQPASAPVEGMGDPADVEKNKVVALLSYIGILWLIPLLAAKDSPFAKYHANQGLILFVAMVVLSVVAGCFHFIIGFIPYIGWLVSCCTCFVYPVISLAWLAYAIMGILNAVNGKMKPLPGIPESLKIIK